MPYVPPTGHADGVLSAHDNQFWLDGNPIILKGANANPTSSNTATVRTPSSITSPTR